MYVINFAIGASKLHNSNISLLFSLLFVGGLGGIGMGLGPGGQPINANRLSGGGGMGSMGPGGQLHTVLLPVWIYRQMHI